MIRHAYQYVAADLAYPSTPIADLPLTGVTWGRMLNGAAEFSGKLKLPPPIDTDTELLLTLWREATDRATKCIYVIRDGTPLGAYVIWNRSYSSDDQTITIGGAELFSYWRRRIVEDASGILTTPLTFTAKRPIDIAAALLAAVNGANLVLDVTPGGGPTIDKTYLGTDARVVADEVLDLAALDAGGFDFRTDIRLSPDGDYERIWIARDLLGGTPEVVAKYETNVANLAVVHRGDLRANDALVMGPTKAGDSTTRNTARRTTAEWAPTMLIVEPHTEDEPIALLDERAIALLEARRNHQLFQVSIVASSVDAELGTFHPGDLMRLVVPPHADPFLHEGLDTSLRLLGYSVTVPDEGAGAETIELTLMGEDED